jgi:hypothetical protein
MPTPQGGETIGERLTRLRAELARTRQVIERAETNGQQFNIGGVAVTQIAVDRAQERERKLTTEIRGLEARLAGGRAATGLAVTQTRIET